MWDVGGLGRTPAASLLQARCRPNRVDSDRPGEYGQQCILAAQLQAAGSNSMRSSAAPPVVWRHLWS